MRFHVRMGVQASAPPRAHVGPIPLLGGVLGAIALGVAAAVVIAVCSVHILTATGPSGGTGTGATPTQRPVDPGTYSAGTLNAPDTLGGLDRLSVTQPSQVELLQSQRNALRQATGKPAIAAEYGRTETFQVLPVLLVASSGYADPKQFLGSVGANKVTFTTEGPDQCAVSGGLAILCIRADQQTQLTVLVEGTPPYVLTPHGAALLVDEAWKKLGASFSPPTPTPHHPPL